MPTRRSHTKSRNGCDQCKRRRVKCDETVPSCLKCLSREVECSYSSAHWGYLPTSPVNDGFSLTSLPPSLSTTPVAPSVSTNGPVSSATELCNLELMHKFSTETYQTVCTDESDHHPWQIVLPKKALDHDFLLNGILAMASLHIAFTTDPSTAPPYVDRALQYYNASFAPFRRALANLTTLNCDAVYAHSIIISIIGVTLPSLTAERGESSSMTENILVVFELLRGAVNIRRIGGPWLSTQLYRKYDFWETPKTPTTDADTEAALTRLAVLNNETILDIDPDQHRINKESIFTLRHCFVRFSNSGYPREDVLAYLARVDKEFCVYLRCRQPLPLLILMHWDVLLGRLDGSVWWARNSGKALVSELLVELHSSDPRWEAARMWPRKQLGIP